MISLKKRNDRTDPREDNLSESDASAAIERPETASRASARGNGRALAFR